VLFGHYWLWRVYWVLFALHSLLFFGVLFHICAWVNTEFCFKISSADVHFSGHLCCRLHFFVNLRPHVICDIFHLLGGAVFLYWNWDSLLWWIVNISYSRLMWSFWVITLRPCVRRKFPNFSFSRVSEMFGFRSSEIFWKKNGIFELAEFSRKTLEKSLEI